MVEVVAELTTNLDWGSQKNNQEKSTRRAEKGARSRLDAALNK